MRIICLAITLLLFTSFSAQRPRVHRDEAKSAFALLNKIRQNPRTYQRELRLNPRTYITKTPLRWNETLAKVAEARALDMAKRDYFDHVDPDGFGANYHIHQGGYVLNADWLKHKSANNFESIAANYPSAAAAIKGLILGKNSPAHGHRKHLLGMDEWNKSLTDVGIGYARVASGSTYQSYMCVIIAKHDW